MILFDNISAQKIRAHAEYIFPDECCGFLLGEDQPDGGRLVQQLKEVRNAKSGDKKRRYEITAKDYIDAEKLASETGMVLLGIYHSHPNHPAMPSETDRLAAQPYFSYVIVSVMQGKTHDIRSWRLNESDQFDEEKFSLI
jgi:proteasome lid subunit RPN8/RPN11